MTVFVVQENNRLDYSPAEEFGDVVFMTAEEYKPVKSSLRNVEILQRIRAMMRTFDPERDYLVLTGNPVAIGFAFHLAASRYNSFRCLQWDRFSGQYKQLMFENPERR